jgi:hypothetical protein
MNDQRKKEQYPGVRDQEIRAALDQHWAASDANDFETEHRIYHEDAVLDYPQSGERTCGRSKIQNQRVLHREHHGVQGRQGCAGDTVLCGSIRGPRMACSMGRTDGHIISRRENSPTTPPLAV